MAVITPIIIEIHWAPRVPIRRIISPVERRIIRNEHRRKHKRYNGPCTYRSKVAIVVIIVVSSRVVSRVIIVGGIVNYRSATASVAWIWCSCYLASVGFYYIIFTIQGFIAYYLYRDLIFCIF